MSGCCFRLKSKRARSIYGTLSVCGFVNKSYAPGACTSVDAIRLLLFDSYSKSTKPRKVREGVVRQIDEKERKTEIKKSTIDIWNPQCLWLCNKSYAPGACTSVDAI